MFLNNKYTRVYYKIIESAKDNKKQKGDGKQYHHIIPKSLGGSDSKANLSLLTYKQHRVCHRLLIKMTTGENRVKMSYAYSWFGKSSGTYKTGSDNNFSKPEIIEIVKARMIANNPMKSAEQRHRMRVKNNNPNSKPVTIDNTKFYSLSEAAEFFKSTPHIMKKAISENLSSTEAIKLYSKDTTITINGQFFKSKKEAINHFKTNWKKFHQMLSDGTLTLTSPES